MQDADELILSFMEEAREHLLIIESSVLQLEHHPEDPELLNGLFRSVHTIKGGSGFFGLKNVGDLTHRMENLLSLARNHEIILGRPHIDTFLSCCDHLSKMVENPSQSERVDVSTECALLDEFLSSSTRSSLPVHADPDSIQTRVSQTHSEFVTENTPDHLITDSSYPPNKSVDEAKECLSLMESCLFTLKSNSYSAVQIDMLCHTVAALHESIASSNWHESFGTVVEELEEVSSLVKSGQLMLDDEAVEVLIESVSLLGRWVEEYSASSRTFEPFYFNEIYTKLISLGQNETTNEPKISTHSLTDISPYQEKIGIRNAVLLEKDATSHSLSDSTFTSNKNRTSDSDRNSCQTVLSGEGLQQDSEKDGHAQLENIETKLPDTSAEESIRVHVKRLNKLIDLAGELVLARNQLLRLCEPLIPSLQGLKAVLHNFNRITTEIQEEIMSTRMQPISVIFNKSPRIIRQLERDLGKRIELVTEGADVELDKTIIEALSDPVTHIIRNMADHGVEIPEERIKKGKIPVGTLVQKAFHESGHVIIQFSDDGAGIYPEFVAAKALEKGLVSQESLSKMSVKEKLHLIFMPGFSTAHVVSSVSGRGIGMDVVRTNIEQIGGAVEIHSEPGKWTTLTLTLPLTMAIISALVVRVGNCRFAFPQGHLEEMVLLQPENCKTRIADAHGQKTLSLRGDFLPLISLADSLGMEKGNRDDTIDKPLHIIIVKSEENRAAIIVDQIVGSEEIVVKPMPEYFRHVKNFSGTSILGNGAIAMIIDVQGYIKRNNLIYRELPKIFHGRTDKKIDQEPQALLIFDNNTEERFALALSWIQRIDALDMQRIQHSAGYDYVEYRGEQMRLLRLEDCLPSVSPPTHYREVAHIIIPKHTKLPVALLINRVIDSKNIIIKLENTGASIPGTLGSMILDKKITLMLDLHTLLKRGFPECVETLEIHLERAKNKRILLVEDTPFFMKVIREILVEAGYQVTTANHGREGLEQLNKHTFDLVLSDIEMPLMDGREMIKAIRANPRWEFLPVIALTTLNDPNTVQEGKKAGFSDWLVKLDKELVLKTLARYLL